MLKDISSVKLQGANFSSLTTLPILDSSDRKYTKVSLLYGRNGSGKSTIAKTFRKMKGEAISTVNTTVALNTENQPIALSEAERASIFVFDEDFVTANVRIEGSGIGSIVMLGEQANLTAQIEQAESELNIADGVVKATGDTYKEYQTSTNPKAPQFYIDKIHGVLQCDDGWAGRDSKARDLRQNSRVSDDTYKRFIALTPEKSRDELIIAFNIKMKNWKL
ncbi:MAG: AAA family ATPase [Oscillospiraceae bacterium]